MSHDCKLPFEAVENLIHLVGSNEKGTHQNDWAGVLFELLLEGEAIIEVNRLGRFPGRTLGIGAVHLRHVP